MSRSLELTVQWDGIIRIGLVSPLSLQDFEMARSGRLGGWLQVVEGLHRRLSGFYSWNCCVSKGGGYSGVAELV